ICEQCGIPIEILPPLAEPGSQEGFLTLEMANLCGLQEGIPVALGTNDAASALMGAGNSHNGDILNISGSSEMVSVLTNIPRIDDRYYLRCSAVPGLWQIYATTAGGFALDWFRKEFCKEMDEQSFFQHEFSLVVEEYLAKTKVHFKPYLAGDRQSLTPKTGVFSGLTLYSTREDLLAAMLLGIHEPIRTVIQTCETFMQLSNTIRLTGGMVNPAYLQVKQMLFPNYRFEFLSNCPIIGNVKLALSESDRKGEKIW
ncbi:MAG: FGGY-family carbohydrate kinase, partial [Sphaerochaetaceae bacterium]